MKKIDLSIKKLKSMQFSGAWKFLSAVLILYALIALRYKYLALEGFINTLLVFGKILPTMLLVFVVMFITNIFIKKGVINKYLAESAGVKGYFYAAVSGIFIAGPPYVLYPLIGDLKKAGMKNPLIAIFLFNRNVKIPFIPIMIFYFGLSFTVIISTLIILFSFLNGYFIGRMVQD